MCRLLIIWMAMTLVAVFTSIVRAQPAAATDEKITQLIESLATSKAKPGDDSREIVSDPKVWQAADALHKLGTAAFPQLIAHFKDERFSFSQGSPASSVVYQRSVGDLCWEIVRGQQSIRVLWKNAPDPRSTPGYGSSLVPRNQKAAEAWWQERRDKTLWELQIEHVQTVIDLNRQNLATERDRERQRLCKEAIEANEKLVSTLKSERRPQKTTPFRPYSGR